MANWDPKKHPRGPDGRFAESPWGVVRARRLPGELSAAGLGEATHTRGEARRQGWASLVDADIVAKTGAPGGGTRVPEKAPEVKPPASGGGAPVWGTMKTAGVKRGDLVMYHGSNRKAPGVSHDRGGNLISGSGGGILARVGGDATGYTLTDPNTGEQVHAFGVAHRAWLAKVGTTKPQTLAPDKLRMVGDHLEGRSMRPGDVVARGDKVETVARVDPDGTAHFTHGGGSTRPGQEWQLTQANPDTIITPVQLRRASDAQLSDWTQRAHTEKVMDRVLAERQRREKGVPDTPDQVLYDLAAQLRNYPETSQPRLGVGGTADAVAGIARDVELGQLKPRDANAMLDSLVVRHFGTEAGNVIAEAAGRLSKQIDAGPKKKSAKKLDTPGGTRYTGGMTTKDKTGLPGKKVSLPGFPAGYHARNSGVKDFKGDAVYEVYDDANSQIGTVEKHQRAGSRTPFWRFQPTGTHLSRDASEGRSAGAALKLRLAVQAPPPVKAQAPPVADQAQVQSAVRDAYHKLAGRPGGWVKLAQLREELGESYSRRDVDQALLLLNRQHDVNVIPESNQKTLTQGDRAAAVVIGNQNQHLISIQGSLGTTAKPRAADPARQFAIEHADRLGLGSPTGPTVDNGDGTFTTPLASGEVVVRRSFDGSLKVSKSPIPQAVAQPVQTPSGARVNRKNAYAGQHVTVTTRDGRTITGNIGGWGSTQLTIRPDNPDQHGGRKMVSLHGTQVDTVREAPRVAQAPAGPPNAAQVIVEQLREVGARGRYSSLRGALDGYSTAELRGIAKALGIARTSTLTGEDLRSMIYEALTR